MGPRISGDPSTSAPRSQCRSAGVTGYPVTHPGVSRRPADETLAWTTKLRRPSSSFVGRPTKLRRARSGGGAVGGRRDLLRDRLRSDWGRRYVVAASAERATDTLLDHRFQIQTRRGLEHGERL